MVRTGYLRWEIEAADSRSPQDRAARQIVFQARPSFRIIRVRSNRRVVDPEAAADFLEGTGNYAAVLRGTRRQRREVEYRIPDVAPHIFRYSEADRFRTPAYWIRKVREAAREFATEVVRTASRITGLVMRNPLMRARYIRAVEWEVMQVVEGHSVALPTNETDPVVIDIADDGDGIPELIAADLVRDVLTAEEFYEFSHCDRVTVLSHGRFYRISRRPHAMVDVWDAKNGRPVATLCVVFEDPGIPPSDEVVMKYLMAKHEPEKLWRIANHFYLPAGRLDVRNPRA